MSSTLADLMETLLSRCLSPKSRGFFLTDYRMGNRGTPYSFPANRRGRILGTFTDFVYLLVFLLSLYGLGIPLFQNSRMVGPGGFCLWLLAFFGSDGNVLAIQNVKWTIFALSSHVFFKLGVS